MNSRIVMRAGTLALALATVALSAAAAIPPDMLSLIGLGFLAQHADAGTGLLLLAEGAVAADFVKVKEIVENVSKAWEEYKKTNDERLAKLAKGESVSDLEAKLAKMEKDVSQGEELNKRLTAAEASLKAAQEAAADAQESVKSMEKKFARPGLGGAAVDPKELRAAWNNWARAVVGAHVKGVPNLSEAERKAIDDATAQYKSLGVQNDATGGYLAPVEMVNEIIKTVTEISPVRQMVRVRSTANKSVQQPKRTGQFAAMWVADQGSRSETDGLRYGMVEIPTHEMYALVDISEQNLEDSAFDLGAEIEMEATEQFALAEGAAVVGGNGVGKPEGFLQNADVGTVLSGGSAITADSLLALKYAVKTVYARNGQFGLNRTTLASARRLKDTTGQYLWMPGLAQGKPNTIDGDPYTEVPDMPSEAANATPVAYGDFRRAYVMVDRVAMSMLRDPYTQATSGNIRFIFRRRVGGMVVLPEAVKLLKCA